MPPAVRTNSLGENQPLSPVDRFGIWLSIRTLTRKVGTPKGKRVADFGAGFNALVARRFGRDAATTTVIDLSLARDLSSIPNLRAIEGRLPDAVSEMPDASVDVALCISVLEHLEEPERALVEFHRVLAPGGVLFLNVPSWLGKRFLEFSAFRLGLSPREEMDDHKRYYDPRDLWPMLVSAGFLPHAITCRRHKAGLNTFAVCRVEPQSGPEALDEVQ